MGGAIYGIASVTIFVRFLQIYPVHKNFTCNLAGYRLHFTHSNLIGRIRKNMRKKWIFTGAAFGCLFGNLLGFSPTLCTAVGMAAVFCGVTNCPITALLISFELFGYDGMPYFLLAVAFSYMLSGYYGLYSSQKIIYSKYKTNYINRKTH